MTYDTPAQIAQCWDRLWLTSMTLNYQGHPSIKETMSRWQPPIFPNHESTIYQQFMNHLWTIYQPFIFHSSRIYQPFFNHLSILSCLDHVTTQCFPSLSRIGCLSELWTCQRWTFPFFFLVRGGSIQADETFQVGDIWYCNWYMLFFLLSLLLLLLCVYYT